MYDPSVTYTIEDFKLLAADDLFMMYREAKAAALIVNGIKLIKKVQKDISNMRILLIGFNAVHNEEQNVK